MQHLGIYRASVYSNKDPLNRRRLKLIVPSILGDSPTAWAWPLENAAIKVDPPSVTQGVWVMFENGDPSYPIWVGTFGKVVDNDQHILVSPNTTSGTYISKTSFVDGKSELNLIATLKSMSDKLDNLEARVSQNEIDISNKADAGHTHA